MVKEIKQQLVLVALVTAMFAACTGLVVLFTDPFTASWLVFSLFYLSVCCTATGLFTLVFYGIRSLGSENALHADRLTASVREASLVGLLTVGSLILASQQVLYWWVELALVVTLALIEMFFLV